ncbi:NrfD/PsrC family molybdoenzyme membrane anchor subunit [Desulfosporosinus hippei]|uniref:Ni/Fe-hydrogenase 2 integral membrane subunit HybB n=1 Tax=Desulfosporosinus hippei DSM 8344 TaxID=1121419 RepID=A0A1G8BHJ2_9FIRM|nr:Ni/Fe-hydrogenase cytochrome b subunit [Desulfosporosinus hippei]SDH32638.1 Ni/Fe-hydrogenase 2 integral membrane subunit HybB [Desulfosporosinus hippei DSM 8344]
MELVTTILSKAGAKKSTVKWKFKMTPMRWVFTGIAAAAIAVILVRFVLGLGATTNLNDQWPWGLWISFDVLLGVALAGGGYGTALIVYVLRRDKFYPIARSAMLTSLLGYIVVVLGLLIEVGQWFNFWRPYVSWGHASVLFEVFWCISCYTVIQILEFCEVGTEKVFKGAHKYLKKAMPVMLIIGITLPTLHQSSLGQLFYLMVGKVNPLWWTAFLPVFFLLSSFFVGAGMIVIESTLAGKALNHKVEIPVLRGLVKISAGAMILYMMLKITDMVVRGTFANAFAFDLPSIMFLSELTFGVIIPIIIAFSSLSSTRKGLIWFGILTVSGVVMNRFDVLFTGMGKYLNQYGGSYVPAVSEFVVSLGLVSIACLAYLFLAENFNILGGHGSEHADDIEIKDGKYASTAK